MDVSLKETFVCVVDGNVRMVNEGTVTSGPSAIAVFLDKNEPFAISGLTVAAA